MTGSNPVSLPFVETERVRLDGRTVLRIHVEVGAMRPCVPAPLYKTETETETETEPGARRHGLSAAGESRRPGHHRRDRRDGARRQPDALRSADRPPAGPHLQRLRRDLPSAGSALRTRGKRTARTVREPRLPVNPEALPWLLGPPPTAYTNLAHICSDQSEHALVLTRFADDGKLRVLDAECVADRCSNTSSAPRTSLDRAVGRGQHLHVRPDVLREALAAALTLRDYARKTSLLVDVTPSNVTFSVIGGLTEPMSPADAALRLRTDCRNPELLRLFDRLGLTAGIGTGIELIRDWAKGSSVEALLNVTTSSVTITLPRLPNPDDPEHAFPDRPEFGEVLTLLAVRGQTAPIARKNVQKALGWSQTRTITVLAVMVEAGLLERPAAARRSTG